jgi:glutaredoxin
MTIEGAAIEPAAAAAAATEALRVFWMPGCSSCVKVKEFLKKLDMPFESVNVLTDPNAETDLRAMGALSFPVVSRGKAFVCAQSLDDVSKFLGRDVKFERLSPAALMDRWFYFCDMGLALVDSIPQQYLQALPIPNRDRTLHGLSYHIFQVPEAFLENAEMGERHFDKYFDAPPPPEVKTSADVRAYGSRIAARLARYWQSLPNRSFAWTVETFYGAQPSHHFLERSVWHTAQHIRQLQVVLDGYQVALSRRIDPSKYDGLPMPEAVWE